MQELWCHLRVPDDTMTPDQKEALARYLFENEPSSEHWVQRKGWHEQTQEAQKTYRNVIENALAWLEENGMEIVRK